ncbi:MAG: hypothetical protein WCV72_03775 [Patescibacteria group bacterium]
MPTLVKSADSAGGAEINSAWYSHGNILDSVGAEFSDIGYLRDYLKDIEDSLLLFNPDDYKHPEIKKGLQALSEEYREIAELVRKRIKELDYEQREIS